jgi:hypothetical protein
MSCVLFYWRTVLVLNIVIRPFLLNLGPLRGKLIVFLVTLYIIKNRISAIFKSVVWWEKSGSVVTVMRRNFSRGYHIWLAVRAWIAACMWLSPQLLRFRFVHSQRVLYVCCISVMCWWFLRCLGNGSEHLMCSWYSLNAVNKWQQP